VKCCSFAYGVVLLDLLRLRIIPIPMTIFAIIAPNDSPQLRAAVRREFSKNFEFSPGQFVASASGLTAAQVAQKLGANGEVGQFVAFSVAGHWGYHRKDLWEWISANPG
jgi:hypothetical protein